MGPMEWPAHPPRPIAPSPVGGSPRAAAPDRLSNGRAPQREASQNRVLRWRVGRLFLADVVPPVAMRNRRPSGAVAFALAAGVAFLVEGLLASLYVVTDACTSSMPSGPCTLSAAATSWVGWIGVTVLLLGLGFLAPIIVRIRVVWGSGIILASTGGYTLLLLVIGWANFVPAPAAQVVMGLLFLPAPLLGLVGGALGLSWEPTRPSRPEDPRERG